MYMSPIQTYIIQLLCIKVGKSCVQQILLNVVQVARNANGLNRLKTEPNGIIRYYQ